MRRSQAHPESLPARALRSSFLAAALASAALLPGPAQAAVLLEPGFWDDYEPYQQYSLETVRDLVALREGDLLETGAEIDGVELRIVGRQSTYSDLISARVVIDSVARERLQVKVLPYELPTTENPRPDSRRRQLTREQAEELVALLERVGFWQAPYRLEEAEPPGAFAGACDDAGRWIIEAVRPGMYQLIARSECGGLDPAAAAILDFLLGIAGVAADSP